MTAAEHLVTQAWVQHLGWSLVQFLWQGTVLALGFAVLRTALRHKLGARSRYAMACAVLGLMVATPVVTFVARITVPSESRWPMPSPSTWRALLPWLVAAWFVGVVVGCVRLCAGWLLSNRLRSTGVRHAPSEWQDKLQHLIRGVGVSRPVRLLVSSLVEIPVVIGWWKPVILVPVGALMGLPPAHIESLLAHELAHIRRFDYLVNVLQSLAESALFYHPAIWWVSNEIRNEREVCCDEVAVAVSGDALTYAQALAEFEAYRPSRLHAVAATGGSLLDRIRRLLGQTPPVTHSLPGPAAALTMSLLWIVGVGAAGTHATQVTAPVAVPNTVSVGSGSETSISRPVLSTLLFGPIGPGIIAPASIDLQAPAASEAPLSGNGTPPPTSATDTPPNASVAATAGATGVIRDETTGAQPASDIARLVSPGPTESSLAPLEARQQAAPTFRAGVDVVEMDVSVTDGNQQPVRGLSAKDFTIFEDGKPQSIIAFSSVELPYPAAPPAAWMSNISADVDSNELAQDRLFVIILDDALIRGMWGQQKMREVARAAIRGLGPTDEAAVIFSGEGWNGQSFTTDRARLLRAIDYVRPTMAEGPGCAPVWGSAAALRSAAEALGEVPHRRKIVLYISDGGGLTLYPDIEARGCAVRVQADAEAAVRAAQRSNTNIYGIDPTGLETTPSPRWGNVQAFPRSFLEDLASHTGGGTVYNTNDPAARVPQILAASRSYYLLGYELATHASTGLYHRVEVRANRPGLEVHARTSRYDPKPDSGAAREAKASPLELAVSGYLPNTGLSVQVSATPFRLASAAGRTSIALAVRVPAGATAPQRDTLDIVTRAFTVDGNSVSSVQARKLVTSDGGVFEAGSAIDLRPGRYTLRIAVHSAATGRTGSVYTDVVVPNFKDDGLTLSGALLTSSSPGLLRTDPFGVLVPIVSRSFASDERVRALLRVYQGGTRRVAPVEVKTRIVDEHDVEVLNGRETLSAAAFSPERQADYALSLPLSTLSPGEYWLSIETSIGSRHASRDVRFSVK